MRGMLIAGSRRGGLQVPHWGSGPLCAARLREGMETAFMGNSEFDDVAAYLLEPEETLNVEQTGIAGHACHRRWGHHDG
jgi:hypothetical protein